MAHPAGGAPGLDDIRAAVSQGPSRRAPSAPYAVIVQHPCGRGAAHEQRVMRHILDAVEACGLCGVILHPNSDPGHDGILREIAARRRDPRFQSIPSLPRADYLRLGAGAAVLIGNSSSGIIESASFGVNAINVGPRQQGRLKCGPGVIDCGETGPEIRAALRRVLRMPRPRSRRSVYGDGRASACAARILAGLDLSPRWLRKTLAY